MYSQIIHTYLFTGIGQLGKLRVLDLEENYLEAIPNEVGRLRELQRLILQSNNLTQLPRAIGEYWRLTFIAIVVNRNHC